MSGEDMYEEWRATGIQGYDVSSLGRVRSWYRNRGASRLLALGKWAGYPNVRLHENKTEKSFFVHRLVLFAFVGPCPSGMEALHWDGDSANAKLSNLRWGTKSQNVQDSIRHGTFKGFNKGELKGELNPKAKLSTADVLEIKRRLRRGERNKDIAASLSLSRGRISSINTGRSWGHLDV